jgi:hypothetical protein
MHIRTGSDLREGRPKLHETETETTDFAGTFASLKSQNIRFQF